MNKIIGEFLVQIAKVVFFIVVIVLAVKLGIYMAKNKKIKDGNNS